MIIPDILRKARRYIEDYDWIELLDDWQRDEKCKSWYLHLSISLDVDTHLFPAKSEWYFIVDNEFPDSEVKVYPSVQNSIETTLYHQAKNSIIAENGLWRLGDICIRENTLESFFQMPYGSDKLLIVSILRARQWLEAACAGSLVKKGDKFELPPFSASSKIKVVYKENRSSFIDRMLLETKAGIVQIREHEIGDSHYMRPTMFFSNSNMYVFHMDWGSCFSNYNEPVNSTVGIWIILKNIPVIKDWQTPSVFEELFAVAKINQIDLKDEIRNIVIQNEKQFRDGTRHFLLIGFPVPEYFESENVQLVWEAIRLPLLTAMDGNVCNGFRRNAVGRWENDKRFVLKPDMLLDWCVCKNWDSSEITQRGALPSCITDMRILIIGAGCVGSMMSELLVREGVQYIVIVDDDILEIGNLTRHTLSIDDVNQNKAKALCRHLANINPNVKTKSIEKKIRDVNDIQGFKEYDLIIDCSASSSVLKAFSRMEWDRDIFMASVSLSIGAKYFFISLQKGKHFEFKDFIDTINSYTKEDEEFDPNLFPRDGVGCWHPAFPARMDDVVSGVALSIKAIQHFIENSNYASAVLVYGKDDDGYDSSYHLLKEI